MPSPPWVTSTPVKAMTVCAVSGDAPEAEGAGTGIENARAAGTAAMAAEALRPSRISDARGSSRMVSRVAACSAVSADRLAPAAACSPVRAGGRLCVNTMMGGGAAPPAGWAPAAGCQARGAAAKAQAIAAMRMRRSARDGGCSLRRSINRTSLCVRILPCAPSCPHGDRRSAAHRLQDRERRAQRAQAVFARHPRRALPAHDLAEVPELAFQAHVSLDKAGRGSLEWNRAGSA